MSDPVWWLCVSADDVVLSPVVAVSADDAVLSLVMAVCVCVVLLMMTVVACTAGHITVDVALHV